MSPKRRSVSSETTINNLNKNVCFLDSQFDHSDRFYCASNNAQLNASYQNIAPVSSMPSDGHQTGLQTIHQASNSAQTVHANGQSIVPYETPANHQDPLLSTISVQTDLDYLDDVLATDLPMNCTEDALKGDHLENLVSDIQTQTYWNSNDNFTQTDFSLFDMEHLF